MRALTIAGWGWFGVVAVCLALRWLDVGGPVPMVQSLLPLAGIGAVVLLGAAAALRFWPLATATAVLLIPFAVIVAPWWSSGGADPADDDVVVMAANLQYGQADMNRIAELVDELGVDVLVLTEATPRTQAAVEDGAFATLPYSSGRGRYDAGGTLVLTATEHAEVEAEQLTDTPFDQVAVDVQVDGDTWRVLGVHTYPPGTLTRWNSAQWRDDLAALEAWAGEQPRGSRVIIAGDLNASQAHPGFRRATAGFDSVHQQGGFGWVRTWPDEGWVPRFIQLDHILVRELVSVDAGTVSIDGTDHAAVWGVVRARS